MVSAKLAMALANGDDVSVARGGKAFSAPKLPGRKRPNEGYG
jgi:hypothetical protein